MDAIDSALRDAFEQLKPKLRDPDEIRRRLARLRKPNMQRPPRAWCLAVRANDTRINPCSAPIVPEDAPDHHDLHRVTIDAQLLRHLCAPIFITPPGEPWDDVAKRLGSSHSRTHLGRLNGIFQWRTIKGLMGRRGVNVPILYTPHALDPSKNNFATPDPLWGATWETMLRRIPRDLEQTLTRIPVHRPTARRARYDEFAHPEVADFVPPTRSRKLPKPPPDYVWYKWKDGVPIPPVRKSHGKKKPWVSKSQGSVRFNGWHWLCPACKRPARYLFYPLPPIALPEFRRFITALPKPLREPAPAPPPCFACHNCHRIKLFGRHTEGDWNRLIAHLTSCLLYGREVPKPPDYAPPRTTPPRKMGLRSSQRRPQVRERLLKGMTPAEIATDIGIDRNLVYFYITEVLREDQVPDREALARKYHSPHRQPMRGPRDAKSRRPRVERMILQGCTFKQIAEELNITEFQVGWDAGQIYKSHGVRNRSALQRKLGYEVTRKTKARAARFAFIA